MRSFIVVSKSPFILLGPTHTGVHVENWARNIVRLPGEGGRRMSLGNIVTP